MDSTKKHLISIESSFNLAARSILGQSELSVLENLIHSKVEIDHSCGGNGTCGTCCVKVIEGLENLNHRNELEQEMKEDRGFAENERLCCQIYLLGPIKIRIP